MRGGPRRDGTPAKPAQEPRRPSDFPSLDPPRVPTIGGRALTRPGSSGPTGPARRCSVWRELGVFLREKRRAVGLRREDVADAAGMGYDWYVRIEQGRARASTDALTRVAIALRLERAETRYVLALAVAVEGSGTAL